MHPTPHVRDWVDYLQALAPSISAAIALCALLATLYVQHKNLKQQLFDKRFAIYMAVRRYLSHVVQCNTNMLPGILPDVHKRFFEDVRPATYLFGSDVIAVLDRCHLLVAYEETAEGKMFPFIESDVDIRLSVLLRLGLETEQAFRRYLQVHHEEPWLVRLARRIALWVDNSDATIKRRYTQYDQSSLW